MRDCYKILNRKFYRHQVSLLWACERLHDLTTGASDCYEPVTPWFLFQYLSLSLENWREDDKMDMYSFAVRSLILFVLSEYARLFDIKAERLAAERFAFEYSAETDGILSQIRGADGEKIAVHRVYV